MSVTEWQFLEVPTGSRENEHIAEEFFSNADVLSEVSGLVRESIQNSLDEVQDNSKPVLMVFTIGRQIPSVADNYFGNLYPHIEKTGLREIPNFTETSTFLVIEDFNTLGLEGPTTSAAPTEEALRVSAPHYKHSFWFFEWKTGGSNKDSGKRGSWGVGKIVFPRASRIKSYLVLSVRREMASPDGNPSIMFGHSILKYRSLKSGRYVPDCQWMTLSSDNEPIPSSEPASQVQFISDWKLSRQVGQLGTSIVVPFCRDTMSVENLVQSIIRDYFISILGGYLECVVKDERNHPVFINKSSIIELIEENIGDENAPRRARTANELKILCEMFKAYESSLTSKTTIQLNEKEPNNWSNIKLPEVDSERIAKAFTDGDIVELVIETEIPRSVSPSKEKSKDRYTVLMKRELDLRALTVFCREGILIPAANTSSNLQNCVSMVIVGSMSSAGEVDNSIANLLKSAEGPSHDRWSSDATNFKGQYTPKYAAELVIRWVKASAERCLRLIQGAENVEDDATLSPYFPFNLDGGVEPGETKVILSGKRDDGDPTIALFSWRSNGFTPTSWVLRRLVPDESDVQKGDKAIGTTTENLIGNKNTEYRFQMTMSDGTKSIMSNIVILRPIIPPPPPPKAAQIEVNRTATGFAITAIPGASLPLNYQFTIRAKYRARGDRIKWTAEDFVLDNQMAKTKISGLKIIHAADNYCQFEIIGTYVFAEWHEFDNLRDLAVDAWEGIK